MVSGVKSVGLNVLNAYVSNPTRIEIREVAFVGEPVAVPEPATYAMALAGLAGCGWAMLRRRRAC